ncbi:hypothetical protein RQM47_11915 [Rubrivirga sp. S365]|uniref:hypothetical protein n=1 Tax=Rubrivirga sp. S365 TaxID=3076080 RepID=UPI0028C6EBD2|nr:hypothetical protein [Rubrivirga sp. S365]MDT7857348.1 hypothetical protein [Rubrivirga sp. S365]
MVLLLDAYHLGDPLFLTGLARDLAARAGGAVLVHGSGERGERALESLGLLPEAVGGAWATATDEEAAAVERATRALSREIVHELNEAGVSAVRALGADRGLLKRSGGGVVAGKTAWLQTLVGQGVVAVVASLVAAADGGPLAEADPAAATAALAGALEEPVTVLLKKGLPSGGGAVSLAAPPTRAALGDPDGAGRLVASGARVVALPKGALRDAGGAAAVPVSG